MILNEFMQDVSVAELIAAGQAMFLSAGCCMMAWLLSKLLWRKKTPEMNHHLRR